MGKYKHFKIKTVKDWEGEYWDAYEERKTHVGIMVYRGWPYGLSAKDEGVGPGFSVILTPEVADFVKEYKVFEAANKLELSLSMVGKFRRLLGIQRNFIYRNDRWLLAHQDELLYDSLDTLKAKYGLTRPQVYQHKIWLAELVDIPVRKRLRKKQAEVIQEQWFQANKQQLKGLTVQEIVEKFDVSVFIAKKFYNRIRQALDEFSFSEKFQNDKQEKRQWLLDHQEELLNSGKTVAVLADQFQKMPGEILRAKARLREILDIPKIKAQKEAWFALHQHDLLNPELSNADLVKKLGLSLEQIFRKKDELRQRLGRPKHKDQVQAWRLENQEILLDLHLSVTEIAKKLKRSEKYIIKNRMILRKFLNITIEDQKRAWVKQHQQDLEQFSIAKIQEKYQLGRYVVQGYRRLLFEMTQNENSS
ncbi:hypothetical protein GCM10025882_07140 [Acinetobacter gyllenbergii]|uniref:Uncharacterized protein n=1 Tax=Acinetobacter gyllenbergii CIP 110306 = MTCC 11365 TaxID=1217657 RepID=A0A829HPB1_9GAMM|nr:hypothetical protein [Acinetobacter gyllenbergii]EPF93337.1 hypothetical protein F957_00307 [Acinetobacter gyllenbergii CIP 110306 = MTCC 11365]EPH31641.1 hypothetical protein L293_2127 [Acinetobacter gyllenbergii CIP 110306 = MTCC 11365]GMA10290.1 hypothetical protein GCM10025882_07140 [Acinetobacter gyllenbergii]